MEDLIKALQIFLKYGNPKYPFHCEHDVLMVCGYDDILFSDDDLKQLDSLGFCVSEEPEEDENGRFYSFKYGSA